MIKQPIIKEIEVGLQIYDLQQKEELCYFSKLVKILDNRISKNTVSMALDRLNDLGMIKESWEKHDGNWYRTIYVASESLPFFEKLHNETIDEE